MAKIFFFLFWRILKFVETRNLNVSLPFFAYMMNFQVSLQKREMFVWKSKDKQISLARFTRLPITLILQQVKISGILRASARRGNSEEVSLNSALVSESDISSSVPSILRDTNTGRNDSSCLLFLKLTAILPHRSCSLRKKRLKLHELTFCLTFRREKPFRCLLLQIDNLT